MKIIHSSGELATSGRQVSHFKKLYEKSFPDPDEREDFELILTRISESTFRDDPKAFLVLSRHGGMVVEYYFSSNAVLITYIAVGSDNRKKGEASLLLKQGVSEILDIIEEAVDKKPAAVFFEVNNPNKINADQDSINPWGRLRFFEKLGAKLIDIPYVQPSLGGNRNRVANLFLCCLPINDASSAISSETITRFLFSFYKALGVEEPQKDLEFQAMAKAIKTAEKEGKYHLKELPKKEISHFEFSDCAVAFHINNSFAGENYAESPYFGSFEK